MSKTVIDIDKMREDDIVVRWGGVDYPVFGVTVEDIVNGTFDEAEEATPERMERMLSVLFGAGNVAKFKTLRIPELKQIVQTALTASGVGPEMEKKSKPVANESPSTGGGAGQGLERVSFPGAENAAVGGSTLGPGNEP